MISRWFQKKEREAGDREREKQRANRNSTKHRDQKGAKMQYGIRRDEREMKRKGNQRHWAKLMNQDQQKKSTFFVQITDRCFIWLSQTNITSKNEKKKRKIQQSQEVLHGSLNENDKIFSIHWLCFQRQPIRICYTRRKQTSTILISIAICMAVRVNQNTNILL